MKKLCEKCLREVDESRIRKLWLFLNGKYRFAHYCVKCKNELRIEEKKR